MSASLRAPRPEQPVYAPPRLVTSLSDCVFYHTLDIPGHGTVTGQWDLRGCVPEYLGHVKLAGKRVLEVGTASGFLCFNMEKMGASVVGYDLCERQLWDIVPLSTNKPVGEMVAEWKDHIRKLNNGWWLGHRAFKSAARVVYGTAYEVPEAIGPVDVATFGCILLHLRDPFAALASACRLATETVIVTEADWDPFAVPDPAPPRLTFWQRAVRYVADSLGYPSPALLGRREEQLRTVPFTTFVPDHVRGEPVHTWWYLSPQAVQKMLGVLGFGDTTVTYHTQTFEDKPTPMFTVVGRRTAPPWVPDLG